MPEVQFFYAIKICNQIICGLGRHVTPVPPYGSAPALDDFNSTHGSASTATNDCQHHEYFVESRLPPYFLLGASCAHWV